MDQQNCDDDDNTEDNLILTGNISDEMRPKLEKDCENGTLSILLKPFLGDVTCEMISNNGVNVQKNND